MMVFERGSEVGGLDHGGAETEEPLLSTQEDTTACAEHTAQAMTGHNTYPSQLKP
jgi:hypothetical protein